MSETPDFDAVARRIVELTDLGLVRQQLILMWNARGAADRATLEATLPEAYSKTLDGALKKLDR